MCIPIKGQFNDKKKMVFFSSAYCRTITLENTHYFHSLQTEKNYLY